MEFIERFESEAYKYTKTIKTSSFVEGHGKKVQKKEGTKDICEVIIGANEIEYSSIEKVQKPHFIINKKLEIASNIEKNEIFSKKFSTSLIQSGLQNNNHISSIFYLNHYYKVHCIIYNQDTKKYYQTTVKEYPKVVCIYKDNKWSESTEEIPEKINYSDIQELNQIIELDVDWMIYKPFLASFSKYKLPELEKIATENDVSLETITGKKKLKKDLFDDINLKHFKKDI